MRKENNNRQRKTWLWVLGWIFIFPVPLTILLLRKRDMNNILKYSIIVISFLVYIGVAAAGGSGNTISSSSTEKTSEIIKSSESEQSEQKEFHLYEKAEVKDVMNGFRDKKLGEYVLIKADSKDCTEENLADLYYNYFAKKDFNFLIILYTDKNNDSGVYMNKAMIGVNDLFQKDEYGDYSVIESPDEIIYCPSEDEKTIKKMNFSEE